MQVNNPWNIIQITELKAVTDIADLKYKFKLLYILEGEVLLNFEQKQSKIPKYNIMTLNQLNEETIIHLKGTIIGISFDYFHYTDTKNIFYVNSFLTPNRHDQQIIKLLDRLLSLFLYKQKKETYYAVFEKYYQLLDLLTTNYSSVDLELHKKNKRLEDFKFFIDQNFTADLKLNELAAKLFISEQYLSKLFSDTYGVTFNRYIITKRLQKVCYDLINTKDTVSHIAYSAGFSNITSFNRLFKKYQHMTPKEYRKHYTVKKTVRESKQDGLAQLIQKNITTTMDLEINTIHKVDTEKIIGSYTTQHIINLGFASDLLNNQLVKQLEMIKHLNVFTYGRIWGILSDEIIEVENQTYDFSKVDEILNEILKNNLTPFLDLSIKSNLIFKTYTQTIQKNKYRYNINSLEHILNKTTAFLNHCIDKFGFDAVSKWKIEFWKPNPIVLKRSGTEELALLNTTKRTLNLTQDKDYFKFFATMKRTIQSILPELQVGGCGLSLDIEEKNVTLFLKKWLAEKTIPDFISISIYPIDELHEDLINNQPTLISTNEKYIYKQMIILKNTLENLAYSGNLFITEFNVTILNRDYINDTAFKGSFILKNILENHLLVDSIGYWQLSDLSSTAFDTKNLELFGGAGLFTKHGLPKIGLFAYEFLNKLGQNILLQEEGLLITKKNRHAIQLLAYYYTHLNSEYYLKNKENISLENSDLFFNFAKEERKKIEFLNLTPKTNYKIKQYSIGTKHGNILEELQHFSSLDELNNDELIYLKSRAQPRIKLFSQKTTLNGVLEFSYVQNPHDILFFEIIEISS